jgi:hypothetical protein
MLVWFPESSDGRIKCFPCRYHSTTFFHVHMWPGGRTISPLMVAFQRRSLTPSTWSLSLSLSCSSIWNTLTQRWVGSLFHCLSQPFSNVSKPQVETSFIDVKYLKSGSSGRDLTFTAISFQILTGNLFMSWITVGCLGAIVVQRIG